MPRQWKSRKDNGRHFQTEGSNPSTVRDMAQKQYFKELLTEGTTYDINEIISKMRGEGRSTISSVNKAQKELDKAEEILGLAQGKIEAINTILETLDQIKSSGRTRIGDSELKAIVRRALTETGVPPSVLDKV
jgi:hypothetical protein